MTERELSTAHRRGGFGRPVPVHDHCRQQLCAGGEPVVRAHRDARHRRSPAARRRPSLPAPRLLHCGDHPRIPVDDQHRRNRHAAGRRHPSPTTVTEPAPFPGHASSGHGRNVLTHGDGVERNEHARDADVHAVRVCRSCLHSASTGGFTRGVAGSFTVRTAPSFPAIATVSFTGTLPTGLAFTDNHDGTATISGTTLDSAATATLSLTASNGSGPDAHADLRARPLRRGNVALPPLLPSSEDLWRRAFDREARRPAHAHG